MMAPGTEICLLEVDHNASILFWLIEVYLSIDHFAKRLPNGINLVLPHR